MARSAAELALIRSQPKFHFNKISVTEKNIFYHLRLFQRICNVIALAVLYIIYRINLVSLKNICANGSGAFNTRPKNWPTGPDGRLGSTVISKTCFQKFWARTPLITDMDTQVCVPQTFCDCDFYYTQYNKWSFNSSLTLDWSFFSKSLSYQLKRVFSKLTYFERS